ncbi:MAG: hypothetical protein HY043_15150 [Verrucomicrobia bacterium]|nr:hypothetical protein [Verrucomicrobiota bacterium]
MKAPIAIILTVALLASFATAIARPPPPVFGPPDWKFTIIAAVSHATATNYGGLAKVKTYITNQIDTVNHRFNDPKVFKGIFQFTVESVYEFTGDPVAELSVPHPNQDFKIVYDGFPKQGGGWYGQFRAIHHSWAVTNSGGPFGADATDGIVHEFGHSRGAIDMYALNVDASKNPINDTGFTATKSIMTYPYGERFWDEYSQHLINKSGAVVVPSSTYLTSEFPASMGVQVLGLTGQPLADVLIDVYPVIWFQSTVTNPPVLSGKTDSKGEFVFSKNPFGPNTSGAPWDLRYPNFLVTARKASSIVLPPIHKSLVSSYAWMPVYDVQNFHFDNPTNSYRLAMSLPLTSFTDWGQTKFTLLEQLRDRTIAAPGSDPDLDGLPNIIEYAFARDPHKADQQPVLNYSIENGYFTVTYTRVKDAAAPDLIFNHQFGRALDSTWKDAALVQVLDASTTNGITEVVKIRDALSVKDAPSGFIRVLVGYTP